jgi:hypothetical protein
VDLTPCAQGARDADLREHRLQSLGQDTPIEPRMSFRAVPGLLGNAEVSDFEFGVKIRALGLARFPAPCSLFVPRYSLPTWTRPEIRRGDEQVHRHRITGSWISSPHNELDKSLQNVTTSSGYKNKRESDHGENSTTKCCESSLTHG